MSRSQVLAYVKTQCKTISGVTDAVIGHPSNYPIMAASLPLVIIGAGQPIWTPMSFSANGSGSIQYQYTVNLVVVLGPADMTEQQAEAAQTNYADLMRNKFSNDLGLGSCQVFYAELQDGIDNIYTFKRAGQQPQVAFHLQVQEVIARNANAA